MIKSSAVAMVGCWCWIYLSRWTATSTVLAFTPSDSHNTGQRISMPFGVTRHPSFNTRLYESSVEQEQEEDIQAEVVIDDNDYDNDNDDKPKVSVEEAIQQRFPSDENPNVKLITLELSNHRPLGCTVEESLNTITEEDKSLVFVSKVVEGGNAEQAGIQVGDILLGVTGLFGSVTLVLESGLEQIKGLVSAIPEENTLVLQVVRGTGVFERHESAIVDLCQMPGASEKELENCMVDFLSAAYADTSVQEKEVDPECILAEEGDDSDCMLDSMMNMWAADLPPQPATSGITETSGNGTAQKPKPWSSRSSPSGTYVRDPVTGEMRNIDA